MSISGGIDLFLLRAIRKAEKLPQTYVLKSSISSAFSDKLTIVCTLDSLILLLTIVCTLDSLILLDQREGEEREIRKLQGGPARVNSDKRHGPKSSDSA